MQPVLTPTEMRAADARAIASGTSQIELVERAGRAVAWHARGMLGGTYGRRVVVVCGKGNNGADGRVAARVLRSWGAKVHVVDVGAGSPPDLATLRHALDRCDLAIDAMYGTGFRGALEGDAAMVDAELYRSPRILAVDIPSGVDGATGAIAGDGFIGGAVLADETLVLGALKPGLLFEPGRFHAGNVTVADIGIDPGPVHTTAWTREDAAGAPLERWPHEHKWSTAVLVIGGSRGMFGAPLFAARAAQRCGAGMVVVAAPAGFDAVVAAPELVVHEAATTLEGGLSDVALEDLLARSTRFRSVVIGPGIGRDAPTQRLVRALAANVRCPVVIDADGLSALSPDFAELKVRVAAGLPAAVLTPHGGEFRTLMGRDVGNDRLEAARALAAAAQSVVLLKGPGTVVATPQGSATIIANGGSELAAAGTGDALSGIIASLTARRDEPSADLIAATCASAAWIHAEAGRTVGLGPSMTASDLIAALAPTLQGLRRGEQHDEARP